MTPEIDPDDAQAIVDYAMTIAPREEVKPLPALQTILPREAVQEACPICGHEVLVRHGHTICTSALCHGRILDGCCGE